MILIGSPSNGGAENPVTEAALNSPNYLPFFTGPRKRETMTPELCKML